MSRGVSRNNIFIQTIRFDKPGAALTIIPDKCSKNIDVLEKTEKNMFEGRGPLK